MSRFTLDRRKRWGKPGILKSRAVAGDAIKRRRSIQEHEGEVWHKSTISSSPETRWGDH